MKTIKIKMPTDAEIMDYAVENYTPPETPRGLDVLLSHVRRKLIHDRQKAALEKSGFIFKFE